MNIITCTFGPVQDRIPSNPKMLYLLGWDIRLDAMVENYRMNKMWVDEQDLMEMWDQIHRYMGVYELLDEQRLQVIMKLCNL